VQAVFGIEQPWPELHHHHCANGRHLQFDCHLTQLLNGSDTT
jgi:hypothetical protein